MKIKLREENKNILHIACNQSYVFKKLRRSLLN